MKTHIKNCRYCNKQFHPKRIDAFYCCSSCRGMANRRKNKPELYSRNMSIHFELDKGLYQIFKEYSIHSGFGPDEYAKRVCILEIERIITK